MSAHLGTLKFKIARSMIVAALVMPAGVAMAQQNPSSQDIVKALRPKALTRGLSISPADEAKKQQTEQFVDTLRNRATRSLSNSERQQIASVSETRPRIDLEIRLDFNSANIAQSAIPDVNNLGKALSDPSLKNNTFVLAGHTDGVGGEEFNQELSNRRADAVKSYLVDKFGVAPDHLVTTGYGKSHLKNANNPSSPENRRVEVVNMAEK